LAELFEHLGEAAEENKENEDAEPLDEDAELISRRFNAVGTPLASPLQSLQQPFPVQEEQPALFDMQFFEDELNEHLGEEAPEENLELTSILSNTMDTSSVSQEEQLRRALYVVHAQAPSKTGEGKGRTVWTSAEDTVIRILVAQNGGKWREIAQQLPDRSDDAVRNRWGRLMELKATGATPDSGHEGSTRVYKCSLCKLIKKNHTCRPPPKVPSNPGEIKAKKSAVGKRITWKRWEDEIILKYVHDKGKAWGEIAPLLSGRTTHSARNRWERLERIRLAECIRLERIRLERIRLERRGSSEYEGMGGSRDEMGKSDGE